MQMHGLIYNLTNKYIIICTSTITVNYSCDLVLWQILQELFQKDVDVGIFTNMVAEESLQHTVVDSIQWGQTHEQTRIVHDVSGPIDSHMLLKQLLNNRVDLVDSAGAWQPYITWRKRKKKRQEKLINDNQNQR